jgi:hypothetical protein
MNMTKKKGSADDFSSILGGIGREPEPVPKMEETPVAPRVAGKTTGNDTQTTLYYPKAWKRRLKEQALHEDTTVNALVLEGIRLLFEKRGISLD